MNARRVIVPCVFAVIVLVVGTHGVHAQSETDSYTTYARGNVTGDIIVPVNEADSMLLSLYAPCTLGVTCVGVVILDGNVVCYDENLGGATQIDCQYYYAGAENTDHTVQFSVSGILDNIGTWRVAGKHIQVYGENPYTGGNAHWSRVPKLMYTESSTMLGLLTDIWGSGIGMTISYIIGFAIGGMILSMVVRRMSNVAGGNASGKGKKSSGTSKTSAKEPD